MSLTLQFTYVDIHLKSAPIITNQRFNVDILNRKSWFHSVFSWRWFLAVTGRSLDREGRHLAMRVLELWGVSRCLSHPTAIPAAVMCALFLSFHKETLPKRPWLTLSGKNRMPALWNCAGRMDVYGLGRTGVTLNWKEDPCSAQFVLSGVHRFFFAIFWNCSVQWWGRGTFIPQALITCYVSSVENTWWKVWIGIQSGRRGHLQLTKLCFFIVPFIDLRVMYVEWRQRMDIIWEILIILQANFIVCISG